MAACTLPAPGTKYGPCAEPCAHQDCACTRRMAAHTCRLCGKEIGYDTRFYRDSESSNPEASVHADCLEDEVEKRQAAAIPAGDPDLHPDYSEMTFGELMEATGYGDLAHEEDDSDAPVGGPPEQTACPICGGHGADPLSDNVNWLPCSQCHGNRTVPARA